MGDRLAVIDRGSIRQIGTPLEVYRQPNSRLVAGLLGPMGFVPADLVLDAPGFWVRFGPFRLRAWAPALRDAASDTVVVGLRPEDVVLAADGTEVTVGHGYFAGNYGVARVELAPGELVEMRTESVPPPPGTRVRVRLRRLHIFDRRTGEVIGRIEDGAD